MSGTKEGFTVATSSTEALNKFMKEVTDLLARDVHEISRNLKVRLVTNKDGEWRLELLTDWLGVV